MKENINNVHLNVDKVIDGIRLATSAIRPTYGPYGVNAIIACDEYPYNKVVNDAKTIIEAVRTHDKEEILGLNLFKELMDAQDKLSGDGRKTTAIIADELITLGRNLDMPKVKLKQQLDALIPLVEAKIDQQKREITVDEIHHVATVSSESEEVGALLGEIYKQIGKDGIIHLEGSNTSKTFYKVTEGIRFSDAGYLSPAMANEGKQAVYENPTILLTKKKITKLDEINPLLFALEAQNKDSLVIFTDDMDSDVARSLVNVHQSGRIKILIIKAPVLWKQYIFEDFAKCVGATIVEDATGLNLKKLPFSALGTCGKIITDAKETILLETKDISEHIASLKQEGSDDSKLRLSWLVTKTCNLYLGANSENDLYYKTMKCKDAINASRLALQDGVIKGGGVCLRDIQKELPQKHSEAVDILAIALKAPYNQLLVNQGLDHNSEEYQITDNILDSSMVIKNAVRSAIGLASTALTIGVSIPFLEKSEEELRLLTATKQAF